MNIRIIRVEVYSKIAIWLLRLSKKLYYLFQLYIWKWYEALKEDPRVTKELQNTIHNDPTLRKVFERFENEQS